MCQSPWGDRNLCLWSLLKVLSTLAITQSPELYIGIFIHAQSITVLMCSWLFQYNACKDNMAWCITCSKRSPSFFTYMGFPPPTSQSYGYTWEQNTRFLELYIARYLYACTKHNCTDVQQAVRVYICNDNMAWCIYSLFKGAHAWVFLPHPLRNHTTTHETKQDAYRDNCAVSISKVVLNFRC